MNDTEKNKVIDGTLYIVSTPIGNLLDMSERAKKVLSEVGFIAAEDTRVASRLLSAYGISKPTVNYFEYNKEQMGEKIIERLKRGESCALVTDAGTPAISDPGGELVTLCVENDVPVTSVPGCCAAINALTLSGLPCYRFAFEGFLSGSDGDKTKRLEELKGDTRTLVFYEAPHRLKKTLALMSKVLGGRRVALCREMTKINEQVLHTTLTRAVEYYEENEPRGEYVLVVAGATKEEIKKDAFFADMTVREHVEFYINSGMSKMDAMKAAARDRGVSKGDIYKEMI